MFLVNLIDFLLAGIYTFLRDFNLGVGRYINYWELDGQYLLELNNCWVDGTQA